MYKRVGEIDSLCVECRATPTSIFAKFTDEVCLLLGLSNESINLPVKSRVIVVCPTCGFYRDGDLTELRSAKTLTLEYKMNNTPNQLKYIGEIDKLCHACKNTPISVYDGPDSSEVVCHSCGARRNASLMELRSACASDVHFEECAMSRMKRTLEYRLAKQLLDSRYLRRVFQD